MKGNLSNYVGRWWVVQSLFALLILALSFRLAQIQFFYPYAAEIEKVKQQQVNYLNPPMRKGSILDRNGEQLAVSIETYSVYVASSQFLAATSQNKQDKLIEYLKGQQGFDARALEQLKSKSIVRLAAGITPDGASYINALKIPGLWLDRHYQRYYPASEVVAQLIGYVDKDGKGIEGLELLYDQQLAGTQTIDKTVKDGKGRVIKLLADRSKEPNSDIHLSLDLQLQYLAYHHLLNGCRTTNAKAGTLLTLDIRTGEVLSLVQYPSFNPNNRKELDFNKVRNRAFTDVFEPGSTIKPLVLASVLEQKHLGLDYLIDTSPGYLRFGNKAIRDARNHGKLNLVDVIAKSSNVGMTLLSQDINSRHIVDTLYRLGFGRRTGSSFPGEREGYIPLRPLQASEKATLSYGYGLSVTPMQLAKAYAVLANGGHDFFISLEKINQAHRLRVIEDSYANQIMETLKKTVSDEGTGRHAMVAGYSLAGKTGTVHKSGKNGYEKDKYLAVFVGLAPAESPRYVTLIVLDEPIGNRYYGGEVAAPVFGAYVRDLLHHYGLPPKNDLSDQHN